MFVRHGRSNLKTGGSDLKKILVFILITVVTASFCTHFTFAATKTKSISDLQKEQKNLKSNKNQTQNLLEQTKSQKESVFSEIEKLNSTLDQVQDELDKINAQLEDTTKLLGDTQNQLKKAQDEGDHQWQTLKKRLRFMYENGRISYLQVLIHSKSFSDFLNRIEYMSCVVKYDQNIFDKIKKNEAVIASKKEEVEKEKQNIEVLVSNQVAKKHSIQSAKEKKDAMLVKLSQEEQKYIVQLDELEKSSKSIEKMIRLAQEQANKQKNARVYTGGKFGYPVPGRYQISSGFEYRKNPFTGKNTEFHSGIDFPAPTGTNVVAAADGVVVGASYVNGYGNAVIINHGSGYSTLYGHNSKLVVKVGDEVKRGQVIAKAGSTGRSTGPHCHFEVRINGKPVDPAPYLKK